MADVPPHQPGSRLPIVRRSRIGPEARAPGPMHIDVLLASWWLYLRAEPPVMGPGPAGIGAVPPVPPPPPLLAALGGGGASIPLGLSMYFQPRNPMTTTTTRTMTAVTAGLTCCFIMTSPSVGPRISAAPRQACGECVQLSSRCNPGRRWGAGRTSGHRSPRRRGS